MCGVDCDDDMSISVLEQLLEERSERDGVNVVKNDEDMRGGHERCCQRKYAGKDLYYVR